MKRIILLMVVALVLTACGQGKSNTLSKKNPNEELPASIEEVEITIAATTDEEAVQLIRSYVADELEEKAYSGLYLEHEPFKHFVILIQELYPLEDVADDIGKYSLQMGKGEGEYRVKLKSATFSYLTLEKVANQLNTSHEALIVTERPVLSFGINEMENRIDLYVSNREDLNEELLAEITVGNEGIVRIEEGVMGSVDEQGIPTAQPYIVGNIMEEKEAENLVFLIDNQIYVLVNSATVIKDQNGNTIGAEQLNVGDKVAVWTDGGIEESLPASGYAVAIQLQ
ncbi:DUF3221 domain-containing protein [Ureibacillus sp. GCM10028918]|uniref:DUF3221 domain-containing protein n=1 Tax=Ureibacillus sp. GCM10028918 TaxID=3273429 RepID=UPI003620152A